MRTFLPHLKANGLTAQQWRVLRALSDAGENDGRGWEMTRLAQTCYLLMPSVSRIIQHLERRSLITRQVSTADLRCTQIRLTSEGARLVEIMAPQSEERYAHITRVYGYGKLELLYELLDELTEKLNAAAPKVDPDESSEQVVEQEF